MNPDTRCSCGQWCGGKCRLGSTRFPPRMCTVHGCDGKVTSIERDAGGYFPCPGCATGCPDAKTLQAHIEEFCATNKSRGPKTGNISVVSARTLAPPVRVVVTRRRRERSASPSRLRTLRPRDKAPRTTRTQRAIMRDLFRLGNRTVAHIAEYVHCGPQEVWAAVNNEMKDTLEEDALYLEGQMGSVVDVENAPIDEVASDAEVAEVDEKLDDESGMDEDTDEEDEVSDREGEREGEMNEEEHKYIPKSSLSVNVTRHDRSRTVVRHRTPAQNAVAGPSRPVNIVGTPIRRAGALQLPTPASRPARLKQEPLRTTSRRPNPSKPSTSTPDASAGASRATPQSTSHQLPVSASGQSFSSGGPVFEFLQSLRRPCGHLQVAFSALGVETAEDLDILCGLESEWQCVEEYLIDRQVKVLEWLIVKQGLRKRGAQLHID